MRFRYFILVAVFMVDFILKEKKRRKNFNSKNMITTTTIACQMFNVYTINSLDKNY